MARKSKRKTVAEGGQVIEVRQLWITQVREDDGSPWNDFGMHTSDAASVLRIYDFREANHPDEQVRIAYTKVEVRTEDPERLREILCEKTAGEESPGLQSS